MDKLRNDGFILIENIKYKKEFNQSLNSFYFNNSINYNKLKNFIDEQYYPVIKNILNHKDKIHYSKFRFSNNNNSTDASTFHGDIYNFSNENIINVYTFLYYFDDAYLEIIPESHRKDYLIKNNSHSSFKNIKKIFIKSGTFVIFHANIHHRGVNFNKGNRRLLQIFDVCLNTNDYKKYLPKLIIVKTYDSYFVKYLTKYFKNFFTNNDNKSLIYLHYFLVYYNIQYKIGLMIDLSPNEKKNKLVSYEPGSRINYNQCNIKDTNVNIICDNNRNHCGPGYFYFYCYIIYWIISILIFYYIWYKTKK
tara:strand:- start:304 stop:1221 length:918 start_codon:yes stop_codon:yes gene_type:complete